MFWSNSNARFLKHSTVHLESFPKNVTYGKKDQIYED